MSLQLVIAEWRMGRVPVEDLPRVAVDALSGGLDSPALVELAGMDGASWSELAPVVERVVAELGGPADKEAARELVAEGWLRAAATGLPIFPDLFVSEELMGVLGGDYEWFRFALYDLELINAIGVDREPALATVRERAALVLAKPREERLAAPPSTDERPLF